MSFSFPPSVAGMQKWRGKLDLPGAQLYLGKYANRSVEG
jgi:hypothetical protein